MDRQGQGYDLLVQEGRAHLYRRHHCRQVPSNGHGMRVLEHQRDEIRLVDVGTRCGELSPVSGLFGNRVVQSPSDIRRDDSIPSPPLSGTVERGLPLARARGENRHGVPAERWRDDARAEREGPDARQPGGEAGGSQVSCISAEQLVGAVPGQNHLDSVVADRATELVCVDQGQEHDRLAVRREHLAKHGELPRRLEIELPVLAAEPVGHHPGSTEIFVVSIKPEGVRADRRGGELAH